MPFDSSLTLLSQGKWRRVTMVVGLEVVAIVLAAAQYRVGIRTDEAKYLLDIPYPHPPLARWILGLTEWMPFQELFWRIVFSSLLIQAIWLIQWTTDNGQRTTNEEKKKSLSTVHCPLSVFPSLVWLFSAAVLLQAGTIMMAPLTALQALVFLWLSGRLDLVRRFPGFVALLWLASLFTAYQAILFLPIVLFIFFATPRTSRSAPVRGGLPHWQALIYVFVPIVLLMLYTLVNPLALASFLVHGSSDAGESFSEKLSMTLQLWVLGGSLVGSIIGTLGIFQSRRWDLLGSLILVFLYIIMAPHDYYAVLFAPLFAAGAASISQQWTAKNKGPMVPYFSSTLMIASAIYFVAHSFPSVRAVSAREVMRAIQTSAGGGEILIAGPFGHEWQYESRMPVRRYRERLLPEVGASICLELCEGIEATLGWERLQGVSAEVWIKR